MIARLRHSLTAAIAALCLAALAIGTAAQAEPVAFVNANVLDGDFESVRENETVLIDDGRIVAVGPASEIRIPEDAERIDLSGMTVIPGLWDGHVHTRYAGIDHLRLLLIHGITTLRDLGGPWDHLDQLVRWREEIGRGQRIGPRIWTGGTVLNNPGAGWAHITEVHSPEEARDAVQRLKVEGADFVKVYSHLSPENFAAIMGEARVQGLPVDGHVPYAITPEQASRAGLRAIEHADNLAATLATREPDLDANGRPQLESLVGQLDPARMRRLADVFQANGTYLVPTLSVLDHFATLGTEAEGARANPALRFIPGPYMEEWASIPAPAPGEWQASADLARQITAAIHDNGVPIVAGTDTVKPYFVPGDALHDELALLVGAGLSEGEALKAATLTPARMMGVADSGLIEPGYVADLVVLDGDPLADIANTRAIAFVVTAGRVLDREELDRMAGEIADEAAQWDGLPSGRTR